VPRRAAGARGIDAEYSYNDAAAIEKLFDLHRAKIAAVIVEPGAANMGVCPAEARFSSKPCAISLRGTERC